MNIEIQKFLTDNLGSIATFEVVPIKRGGSDRAFFRVLLPYKTSFIFMHYGTEVEENSYWADIARFLTGIDVCVPQIIAQDLHRRFILMEDLGDIDLWSLAKKPWSKRCDYYFKVLQNVLRLHAYPLVSIPANLKLSESYGPRLYKWEHDYFLKNLVQEVCKLKISPSLLKDLNKELDGLVIRLQNIEPCLIHRDFQSQNIMIKNDQPVLIDFQGMRPGNFFYDLASLICDPYVTFAEEERNELISFYYRIMQPYYSIDEFTASFWEASAQRLMQALGAYGFLGLKKRKSYFLKHVYNGIRNLFLASSNTKSLLHLHELSQQCESALADRQI